MEKMTTGRFILYLLKHGHLVNAPVDFQAVENTHLDSLTDELGLKKTHRHKLGSRLAKHKYFGSLLGNIAYFKNRRMINRNYFFVDRLKLGYVRIFKSASTSVLKTLLPMMDSRLDNKDLSDKQIDLLANYYSASFIAPQHASYELFTIVRNPLKRLVSVYLDLFNPENPHFGYGTYLFGILRRDMTFREFVSAISIIPESLKSGHLASQTKIIRDCGGFEKIIALKLEDDDAVRSFLSAKGIALHQRNKHEPAYDYRNFYDLETAKKVFDMYSGDMKMFRYESEFETLVHYLKG